MTASDLYATTQGYENKGPEKCHWCGSSCTRQWQHDDPGPVPFQKGKPFRPSLYPNSPWICMGCWAWRRKRLTVRFLNGERKDGQCPEDYSWWIEKGDALAIRQVDYSCLTERLLDPPLTFSLLLKLDSTKNFIQLGKVNSHQQIKAETTLSFSADNVVSSYTVYELERAGREQGTNGMMPGTRFLATLLSGMLPKEEDKGRGRPTVQENIANAPKRIVKEEPQSSKIDKRKT